MPKHWHADWVNKIERLLLIFLCLGWGLVSACETRCLPDAGSRAAYAEIIAAQLFPSSAELPPLPLSATPPVDRERLNLPRYLDPEISREAVTSLWCDQEPVLTIFDSNGVPIQVTGAWTDDDTFRFPGVQKLAATGPLSLFVHSLPQDPESGVPPNILRETTKRGRLRPQWFEKEEILYWPITIGTPAPVLPTAAATIEFADKRRFDIIDITDQQALGALIPPMFSGYNLNNLGPLGWIRQGAVLTADLKINSNKSVPLLAAVSDSTVTNLDQLILQPTLAVMVHGLRACKESWLPFMSVLSAMGIASVAFDLPGHGERAFPEGFVCGESEPIGFWEGFDPYAVRKNLLEAAEEVILFVGAVNKKRAAAGLRPAGIVSHSLGTFVAIRTAEAFDALPLVFTAPTGNLLDLWEHFLPSSIPLANRMDRLRMTRLFGAFDMQQLQSYTGPILLQVMGGDKTVGNESALAAAKSLNATIVKPWTVHKEIADRLPDPTAPGYPNRIADTLNRGDHLSPVISRVYGLEGSLLALEAAQWLDQGRIYADPGSTLADQMLQWMSGE